MISLINSAARMSSNVSVVQHDQPNYDHKSFKYDVFVSFRGSDTRENFTKSLVERLRSQGVAAFFDEVDLEKGQKIDALFDAIHSSRVFVVVVSEHYGDSRWCMKEMREIVKTGRTFIPVFYGVDPKDVRHQAGEFGEAFKRGDCVKEDGMIVREFVKALQEVGGTSGHVLMDANNYKYVEEVLKSIVSQVRRMSRKAPLSTPKHRVGLESRVSEIMSLLQMNSTGGGVQVIGIQGCGGIGKSTLALETYNNICNDFSCSCFIPNVREEATKNGLCRVQQTLLSGLVSNDGQTITSVEMGMSTIKRRLQGKHVLIVLDDIDNKAQLDALIGDQYSDFFGDGSRIIITTRDVHVLHMHGVDDDHIYKANGLNRDESFELFCYHAFGGSLELIKPAFESLSNEFVTAACGLPLAIEVYGCCLKYKKNASGWEKALRTLSGIPSEEIHKRLRVSLLGLDKKEIAIFLDTACFFVGRDRRVVDLMWEDDDQVDGSLTLNKLIERALVKLDKDDTIQMHDVIVNMARSIVRDEASQSDDHTPSRIWDWDHKVAHKFSTHPKSLEKVEGIYVDSGSLQSISLDSMLNLRILHVTNGDEYEDEDMPDLPRSLEFLDWEDCPIYYIPHGWDFFNITQLYLPGNQIERWSVEKELPALKILDLSCSLELKSIAGFHNMPNLVYLLLHECQSLSEVDESIGYLKFLLYLDLRNCSSIEVLPSSIGTLSALEELRLYNCCNLQALPESIGDAKHMKLMELSGTGIKDIPDSVGNLTSLEKLYLCYCEKLKILPESIGNCKNLRCILMHYSGLESLPSSLSRLEKLEILDIVSCRCLINGLPGDVIESLHNLRVIVAGSCNLKQLPDQLCNLSSLEELYVENNKELEALPERLGSIKSLRKLDVATTAIQKLPESMCLLQNLEFLKLRGCSHLEELPSSIGRLTALRSLDMGLCRTLKYLPDSIGELRSLNELDLTRTGIENLPESIGNLQMLEVLKLAGCKNLTQLPPLQELKSLKVFTVYGCRIQPVFHEYWKLPNHMRESKPSSSSSTSSSTDVIVSSNSEDYHSERFCSLLMESLKEKGVPSIATANWVNETVTWQRDCIRSCKVFIIIISNNYIGSDQSMLEFSSILDSATNNKKQKLVVVYSMDQESYLHAARENPRWEDTLENVWSFGLPYYRINSQNFSESSVLHTVLFDVFCNLEEIDGKPWL